MTFPRRFRKRPVVIEASLLTERTEIHTLEGVMVGNAGDWLITGVKGEKYPCKPDIFAGTYEEVTPPFEQGCNVGACKCRGSAS